MKVFVTGVGGQLGFDVMNRLKAKGHEPIGSDILDSSDFSNYVKLDITDENAVKSVLCDIKPDVVIHCAAWTAVDAAEDEENTEKVSTESCSISLLITIRYDLDFKSLNIFNGNSYTASTYFRLIISTLISQRFV